ncbi:unnamed protein product [Kuraishia capsulata CBS 1993]|uniref:Uncharacterized protein n=1 Tax=Kuraishia capsulata CBS 1993 TaxID=1382522 RepID=W6MT41_9ASCO|nr:unnamed protein product [Kuraishia capsulata CBS 1993]
MATIHFTTKPLALFLIWVKFCSTH